MHYPHISAPQMTAYSSQSLLGEWKTRAPTNPVFNCNHVNPDRWSWLPCSSAPLRRINQGGSLVGQEGQTFSRPAVSQIEPLHKQLFAVSLDEGRRHAFFGRVTASSTSCCTQSLSSSKTKIACTYPAQFPVTHSTRYVLACMFVHTIHDINSLRTFPGKHSCAHELSYAEGQRVT